MYLYNYPCMTTLLFAATMVYRYASAAEGLEPVEAGLRMFQ